MTLCFLCRYTEVEVLNGANQYKTDDFGMQVGVNTERRGGVWVV